MSPVPPIKLPEEQFAALETAYAKPPRAYHDFNHVREVLRHHAEVAAGPGWAQPAETFLAVLYHDAVYEAGRGDNETRSAELAVAEIAKWLPEASVDASRVAELIELTARHGQFAPGDFGDGAVADDTRHFLDCDMAILGAEPAVFDAYDRGIAPEYRGTVPACLFRLNRPRFLQALLGTPRICLTAFFHARLAARARAHRPHALNAHPPSGVPHLDPPAHFHT